MKAEIECFCISYYYRIFASLHLTLLNPLLPATVLFSPPSAHSQALPGLILLRIYLSIRVENRKRGELRPDGSRVVAWAVLSQQESRAKLNIFLLFFSARM
jgi:hypothetical protein